MGEGDFVDVRLEERGEDDHFTRSEKVEPRHILCEVGSGLQLGMITQLPGGQVRFDFTGASGRSYVIQASTNLTDWQNLRTNVGVAGPISFIDSFANFTRRFYRVRAVE